MNDARDSEQEGGVRKTRWERQGIADRIQTVVISAFSSYYGILAVKEGFSPEYEIFDSLLSAAVAACIAVVAVFHYRDRPAIVRVAWSLALLPLAGIFYRADAMPEGHFTLGLAALFLFISAFVASHRSK